MKSRSSRGVAGRTTIPVRSAIPLRAAGDPGGALARSSVSGSACGTPARHLVLTPRADTTRTDTGASVVRMPDLSDASRTSVALAAASLSGQRLQRVTYWVLRHEREDWDAGTHHRTTMGVELLTSDGQHFTACWGDALGRFGLELLVCPAVAIFKNDPAPVDATGHPWWKSHQLAPITAELIWGTGYVDDTAPGFHGELGGRAPVALLVTALDNPVWIAAAEAQPSSASDRVRGGHLLGSDAVLVTGDRSFAKSIGILDAHSPRP